MFEHCRAYVLSADEKCRKHIQKLVLEIGFKETQDFLTVHVFGQYRRGPMPFLILHNELDSAIIEASVGDVRSHHNRDIRFMPIIMMTSDTSERTVRHFMEVGFDDIVLMPFDTQTLRRRLGQQINKQRCYFQTGRYFGPDRRKGPYKTAHPDRRGGTGSAYRHFVIQRHPGSGIHILHTETFTAENQGFTDIA